MTLNKSVNPVWFNLNERADQPDTGLRLVQDLGQRPDRGLHHPAKREEDLRLLARVKQVTKYTTDPLWKVTDGPYNLTSTTTPPASTR
jgi:hypothetical protein